MKNILLINASPRKGGNSDTIINSLAEQLAGNKITTFHLREKKLNPCQACGWCQGKSEMSGCILDDDFAKLLPIIEECDAIVLAAPIYYNQINAPAKLVFDRLYPFFKVDKPQMTNAKKMNKKAALICSCWGSPREAIENYADYTAQNFTMLGAAATQAIVFDGIPERGDILKRADYLKQITELSQWLAE